MCNFVLPNEANVAYSSRVSHPVLYLQYVRLRTFIMMYGWMNQRNGRTRLDDK